MKTLPKKLARTALAVICVAVGLAGVVLPVLPGWPFLLVGLWLLSHDYRWAKSLVHGLEERFPRIARHFRRGATSAAD